MTVNTNTPVSGPYLTDGVNKSWQFQFKIADAAHMTLVTRNLDDSDEQVITTGFTIDVAYLNNDAGGYVIYPAVGAALATGRKVFAVRNVPYSQPQRIGNQGQFYPQTHEDTFDLVEMQIQQLKEKSDRTLTALVGQDPTAVTQQLIDAVSEAEGFATAAAGSAASSASSASDASDSADLANRFANEAEDVPVLPGLFSAKHFMLKAQAIYNAIANTLAGWIHAATEKVTLADADEFGLADSGSSWGLKKTTAADLLLYVGLASGLNFFTGAVPSYVSATSIAISSGAGFFGGKKCTLPAYTKLLNAAWAAGNAAGMLDTGAIAANQTYFIHSIRNLTTGVCDYLGSLSLAAPTVPAGWEVCAGGRVGIIVTNGSSQIIDFKQDGNRVTLSAGSSSVFSTSAAVAATLTTLPSCPIGIAVDALLSLDVSANSGGDVNAFLSDANNSNASIAKARIFCAAQPSANAANVPAVPVRTNAAAQVYRRVTISGGTALASGAIWGWIDYQCRRLFG